MRSRIPGLAVILGALLGLFVACRFGVEGNREPASSPSSRSSAPAVLSPAFTSFPQPSPTPAKPGVQIRLVREDGGALRTVPDCATLFANEGRDYLLVFYLPPDFGFAPGIDVFDRNQEVVDTTLYAAGSAQPLPHGWQGAVMTLSELYSWFSSPPTPESELIVQVSWETSPRAPGSIIASGEIEKSTSVLCKSEPWTPEPLDLGYPQDLAVADVFLYYDSAAEEGTFAATVCNLGGRTSPTPFNLVLEANGVIIQQEVQRAVLPGACIDVFSLEYPFSAFGIQQPGQVQVRAQVVTSVAEDPAENNVFATTLKVARISTRPSQKALSSYQTCLQATREKKFPEGYPACTYLLKGAPLAERDEVSAQKEDFIVVVPRPLSSYIGTMVSTLASCGEQTLRLFPWANPESLEPWMAFGYPDSDTASVHAVAGYVYFIAHPHNPYFWFVHPRLTQGRCAYPFFPHEFVHVFLQRFVSKSFFDERRTEYASGASLPFTLDEGLATWGSETLDPQPYNHQCYEQGFIQSGDEVKPYLQLGKTYEEQMEILKQTLPPEKAEEWYADILYGTGVCFWKYIEGKYGVEAISRIVEKVANSSQDLCVPFLDTYVAPVIGKEDYPIFKERFGISPELSTCDF